MAPLTPPAAKQETPPPPPRAEWSHTTHQETTQATPPKQEKEQPIRREKFVTSFEIPNEDGDINESENSGSHISEVPYVDDESRPK